MGHQIIKQPDGKYAIWSSIVDNFVAEDLAEEDVIDFAEFYYENRSDIERTKEKLEKVKKGEPAYNKFTKSYAQACGWRDFIHKKIPLPENFNEL